MKPQLPPKQPLHGWIILDKPLNMTSTQAVGMVKRILRPLKIGHAGTLDPLASGILPLALGEATKLMPYLFDAEKTYRFTVEWGAETETDDKESAAVNQSAVRPSEAEILVALPGFVGRVWQTPPIYSAIKLDGQRAYDLARGGEIPEMTPREVDIHSLTLLECPDNDHASFEMTCGKGTYVRSLARELGRKLGCFGHVSMLRRTAVGNFSLDQAISLENQGADVHTAALNAIRPPATVLDDIPAVEVGQDQARKLRHGQPILLPQPTLPENAEIAIFSGSTLLAIGEKRGPSIAPLRVFNL
ncbi:MAG: tRNA pseudouridine(55) synthase TruB [Alphaproteobacteria bacterium]|nr:tRNA pseudouridine(55) synthase TruB [Alphaproteobacteria bacterium]